MQQQVQFSGIYTILSDISNITQDVGLRFSSDSDGEVDGWFYVLSVPLSRLLISPRFLVRILTYLILFLYNIGIHVPSTLSRLGTLAEGIEWHPDHPHNMLTQA